MLRYFAGLDLGQAKDHTAVAILDRVERAGELDRFTMEWKRWAELRLRHLERMPAGTPYTEVVERVRQIVRSPDLLGQAELIVDATGVGRPVVDLLRRADLDCPIYAVTITGGDRERSEMGQYYVPKRDLITDLQVLTQARAIRVAAGLEWWPALVKEMQDMRVRITLNGNTQFGAWREGQHDDLVLALALACWGARAAFPCGTYGQTGPRHPEWKQEWERGSREPVNGRGAAPQWTQRGQRAAEPPVWGRKRLF